MINSDSKILIITDTNLGASIEAIPIFELYEIIKLRLAKDILCLIKNPGLMEALKKVEQVDEMQGL